jgi:tRNA threonylcarbamoyl adenosine modification protein YeaZ
LAVELVGPPGRRAGQALHGLVAEALRVSGLAPADLGRVVAVRGPGSFTGLRIGLAAVAGLALGLGVPTCGVGTSRCVAAAAGVAGLVLVWLPAGLGGAFLAWHEADGVGGETTVTEPRVVGADEARAAGRQAAERGATLVLRGGGPEAEALVAAGARTFDGPLALAAARRTAGGGLAAEPPTPLYVRAPSIRPQAPAR